METHKNHSLKDSRKTWRARRRKEEEKRERSVELERRLVSLYLFCFGFSRIKTWIL